MSLPQDSGLLPLAAGGRTRSQWAGCSPAPPRPVPAATMQPSWTRSSRELGLRVRHLGFLSDPFLVRREPRSSSREDRITVPDFYIVVDFSRGTLPTNKGVKRVLGDLVDNQSFADNPKT